jgi:hypothetical protein
VVMGKEKQPQIGKSKIQIVDNKLDWGVYVWKKSNNKWFTDGDGNILNIPSRRGDLSRIAELRNAAAYYGEPDGEPVFFGGLSRVTDEEYSEQMERMKEGLIPSQNDFGAWAAAKKTYEKYGSGDE